MLSKLQFAGIKPPGTATRSDDHVANLFEIRREKQKGRQRRGADGVALGQRLGGVARRVELVSALAADFRLVRHFDDAAGVVGDRPEGVHRQNVGSGGQHPHCRDSGAVNALGIVGYIRVLQPAHAEIVAEQQGRADDQHRQRRSLHSDGKPADDVRRRAGEGRLRNRLHRPIARFRVVLRNHNEEIRCRHAQDAAAEQPPAAAEHEVDGNRKADDRQHAGHVIAPVQRVHRLFILSAADDHHADGAGDQVDGMDDQRKQNSLEPEDRIERRAENHRAHAFRSGRLEDVRSTAGAVAHIVANQVGDDGRVARIVLRNSCFHFADQVRADVGGLGVDAAAELRKQRDQRCAKSKPDQAIGNFLRMIESPEGEEQQSQTEQSERHHDQSGDCAAAQGGLDGAVQAGAGRAGGADIRSDRNVHSRYTRRSRNRARRSGN